MSCHSFFCVRCRRRIQFSGSRYEAVRNHYWRHHRRSMLKGRKKKRRRTR